MTEDAKDVQPEAVPEGTESKEGEAPKGDAQPEPQPSDAEKIAQMVKEEVAKQTEGAKREIQSAKDKARAEVESAQTRAELAERTLAGYEGAFTDDPDKAELAKLKAEKAARGKVEADAQRKEQLNAFDKSFRTGLTEFITQSGIDPTDKRIDWADEVQGDYLVKQNRVLSSISKIQSEDKGKIEQRLKDLEAKVNEEANSVDTDASGGASDSDTDFYKKFGLGEVPMTKANLERAEKIRSKGD